MVLDPKNYDPALMYGATMNSAQITDGTVTGADLTIGTHYGAIAGAVSTASVAVITPTPAITITGVIFNAHTTANTGVFAVYNAGSTVATINLPTTGIEDGVVMGPKVALTSASISAGAAVTCKIVYNTLSTGQYMLTFTSA